MQPGSLRRRALWSTAHWGPAWFDGFWNPRFPRQITDRRLVAEPVATGVLEMEGKELRIIELGHTNTDGTSALATARRARTHRPRASLSDMSAASPMMQFVAVSCALAALL